MMTCSAAARTLSRVRRAGRLAAKPRSTNWAVAAAAGAAYRVSQGGHVRGKLVLIPDRGDRGQVAW